MFLPSTIFGHVALICNHQFSSPDVNNKMKKVYNNWMKVVYVYRKIKIVGVFFFFFFFLNGISVVKSFFSEGILIE